MYTRAIFFFFFLTSWQFHGMRPGQNHSQLYVCHSLPYHGGGVGGGADCGFREFWPKHNTNKAKILIAIYPTHKSLPSLSSHPVLEEREEIKGTDLIFKEFILQIEVYIHQLLSLVVSGNNHHPLTNKPNFHVCVRDKPFLLMELWLPHKYLIYAIVQRTDPVSL